MAEQVTAAPTWQQVFSANLAVRLIDYKTRSTTLRTMNASDADTDFYAVADIDCDAV